MQYNEDTSASGYLTDPFEGISRRFTDVEILSESDVNIVAKAKRYGRWWLLKGLRQELACESVYSQMLRKELEVVMKLQHPCIPTAIGLEHVENIGECIVMEYVDGVTLTEWLSEKHERKVCRRIAMKLVEVVAYIHMNGVVHRDLKPDNILIARNGETVHVIDFGLADTDSHAVLKQPAGTLRYMSPEQATTAVADVRNDIYSLGIIFNKMNLGYSSIVNKCLRPIDNRYQNIDALLDDMRLCNRKLRWYAYIILVCIVMVLLAVVIMLGIRDNNMRQMVAESEIKQNEMSLSIDKLNDSLANLSVVHQKMKNELKETDAKQKRVHDAISKGKTVIDDALKSTGVWQQLDTLSAKGYCKIDMVDCVMKSGKALNDYLEQIKSDFTDDEMAEIINALAVYNGERINFIDNKINEIK